MLAEQKVEQANVNTEQEKTIDKSIEASLDSNKKEQAQEVVAAEKSTETQASSQVVMPSTDNQQITLNNHQIIHRQVENVLSDGMENVFLSLDAGTQRIFKLKGEETSNKITNLLMQAKVKVSEVTKLILEWLRVIPQVNKHYLEQEAKIKTDNILKINKQK